MTAKIIHDRDATRINKVVEAEKEIIDELYQDFLILNAWKSTKDVSKVANKVGLPVKVVVLKLTELL
jgi:hypothetical protein